MFTEEEQTERRRKSRGLNLLPPKDRRPKIGTKGQLAGRIL